jgi:heat shock protein beta
MTSIDKVLVSPRLTKSPFAIVANQWGWSGNMERLMTSQALQAGENYMAQFQSTPKKTLELNPTHPLVEALLKRVDSGERTEDLAELCRVVYETTAIRSGYSVKDSAAFAQRVERVIRTNLGVDQSAEVPY